MTRRRRTAWTAKPVFIISQMLDVSDSSPTISIMADTSRNTPRRVSESRQKKIQLTILYKNPRSSISPSPVDLFEPLLRRRRFDFFYKRNIVNQKFIQIKFYKLPEVSFQCFLHRVHHHEGGPCNIYNDHKSKTESLSYRFSVLATRLFPPRLDILASKAWLLCCWLSLVPLSILVPWLLRGC